MAETFITDQTISNTDVGIDLTGNPGGADILHIRDVTLDNTRIAMRIRRFAELHITNVTRIAGSRQVGEQFAYCLALGNSSNADHAVGRTFIDNLQSDDLEAPSDDYDNFNQDTLTLEKHCGPVLIKDSVLGGATDGVIDSKAPVKIVRTSLGPSYLQFRVWDGNPVELAQVTWLPNPNTTQTNFQWWFEETPYTASHYSGGEPFLDEITTRQLRQIDTGRTRILSDGRKRLMAA